MALGISEPAGNGNVEATIAELEAFKAETGRYPALWTVWSAWGNPGTKDFPTQVVKAIAARRAAAFVFWEPAKSADVCTDHSRLRKIARGKFDGYVKKWARAAKKSKATVLVRFAHEINGKFFPWTIGRCGNKTEHYLKAWKRVHHLVRDKVGAKNVKFVWTVNRNKPGRGFGANPYAQFFPGARYVQYMGYSSFNWGEIEGKDWKSMLQGVQSITQKLQQLSKKPIIVAELGSNHIGGDKAAWIQDGYPEVYAKLPRIKAVVYLNVDLSNIGHPDWRLTTPDAAMDAYTDVMAQPRFQGRVPR